MTRELSPPPRRVRVTHPRTDAARSVRSRPTAREIDEQTPLGEVYISTLMRSQRRLAAIVCAGVTTLLIGIALTEAFFDGLARVRLGGVPLPWLVLGLAVYPAMIALGWYAVRSAERNEAAFIDLLDES